MKHLGEIARIYLANRKRWENICNRCGRCCFERDITPNGELAINYAAPCDFLNLDTHECAIYERRFCMQPACKKLTLWDVLFNKLLPEECAYKQLFSK